MVSTYPPIFKSSSPFINPLGIVSSALITIIIITIIIIIIASFSQTLNGDFLVKSEWQQFSTGLLDSSIYPNWF